MNTDNFIDNMVNGRIIIKVNDSLYVQGSYTYQFNEDGISVTQIVPDDEFLNL